MARSKTKKSKKKKRKVVEYSSHEGSSSESEAERAQNKEGDKRRRLQEKEWIKAHETSNERRARRLKKKEMKLAKQKEKEENSYFGYSNHANPFGDDNLTELFIWKKKYEQEGKGKNEDLKTLVKTQLKKKQRELGREIEKTRERRKQRQQEAETLEALQAELAREREIAMNEGWREREEGFHKQQCIIRSKLRIKQKREKAIDKVAKNIHRFYRQSKMASDGSDMGSQSANASFGDAILNKKIVEVRFGVCAKTPMQVVSGLDMFNLEDFEIEMKQFKMLGECEELWECVAVITEDRKQTLAKLEKGEDLRAGGIANVTADVQEMLREQSYKELLETEAECKEMLSEGMEDVAIDEEYWQAVLNAARLFKARARLKDNHKEVVALYQAKLEREQRDAEERGEQLVVKKGAADSKVQEDPMATQVRKLVEDVASMFVSRKTPGYQELWAQSVSAEEDVAELTRRRQKRLREELKKIAKNKAKQNPMKHAASKLSDSGKLTSKEGPLIASQEEEAFVKRQKDSMEDGEHETKMVVNVPEQAKRSYHWHEKYRPRKPKYFNKVKTGYSWNKYNQTHYDHDNPPPKIVQGYKFNIFYPDLIDPSKTPTYKVFEQIGSEYATIVFHAGPPYEDIAFKVVNNDWETNHKRGFRCRFEKGIFSLYFNFRRHFYRR